MDRIDPDRPVESSERLHALDVLRGLALFGMILVHFHQKTRSEATGIEDLIGWGVWVLVEQKAWGTFAFLFGAGFAILLRRLERRGSPIVAIYLRRLATLALFGIIAEVGFGFKILFGYACWGLALLVMRRWSSPALFLAAAVSASARPVVAEIVAIHAWWTSAAAPAPQAVAALTRAVDAAAGQASYLALCSARWSLFIGALPRSWRDILPDVNLALFVLGLLAVRHGILDTPKRHVRLIAGWMTFGAAAWACSWLVLPHVPAIPIPGAAGPFEYGFGLVQDQWLCFTYIGAIVLVLAFNPEWTARLALFGVAGRMALTNYMMQAAVLDALSSGYGAHLKLRPYVYPVAAVLLFSVQVAISRAWLSRYRFGPLEWLWRAATYARVPPLRRVHAEVQPI